MESIVRNVREIDTNDRRALEHVVGISLRDNQRLIIQLSEIEAIANEPSVDSRPRQTLEDWTRVYDGLTDAEIEEIDQIANTRANFTRNIELP